MKLFTLIENQKKLEKAEIEIQMIPGVPQIHFLGLPDQTIKESFLRIKSALKVCGFKFPMSQQMIVNIKPNHLKKTSKGLELAVALGILHMTGQKILSDQILQSIIYGELSLNGEVNEPSDLRKYSLEHTHQLILSGKSKTPSHSLDFCCPHLNADIEFIQRSDEVHILQRPEQGLKLKYTEDEAELLFLIATTKMHLLLSGPAGFGKSTLGKNSISFILPTFFKSSAYQLWPLLLAPHSSVTPAAFLGGGAQLYQGEIERVQNGILFLDELLEFDSEIIETLRGPMTGEKLRLSRSGQVREFDCDFQVVATSNLCPCGKWTPDIQVRSCRFSNRRCQSYLEKLSGPILDRFGLYYYYPQKNSKRTVKGEEVLQRIEGFEGKYRILAHQGGELCASPELENLIEAMYPEISLRRRDSLFKVARVYAIERESSTIELADILKAEKWTYSSFLQLDRGMS